MEGPLSDRERWDRRYAAGEHGEGTEPEWLEELGDAIPRSGRALDVASGTGRASRWLARRGLGVLAIDVSPVGLALAREHARAAGLEIETREIDLLAEPLPEGPWDVITCLGYLKRDLFPSMREALAPGGLLVCGMATVRNLERHTRPPAAFLLDEGELPKLVAPFEVLWQREGWFGDRALARVVARKV